VEYRKLISGEAVKGFTAGVVVILLPWVWQIWITGNLEYRQFSKDGYLATGLGQQGLTMSYGGKPLKNVSIVEFIITNRTSRQFTNVDLLFSVDDSKSPMTLVSSGIITPVGLPHTETVVELPVKDVRTKIFRLKVIPKQQKREYFDAIFVFDGEKAPSMSVVSLSNDVSIGAYKEWKDEIKAIFIVGIFVLLTVLIITGTTEYLAGPRLRRRGVERFSQHAVELRNNGKLKSTDEQVIDDAATIYASFIRPRPIKILSTIFGRQHFDN
jgi:hypothetical protein